VHQGTIILIQF